MNIMAMRLISALIVGLEMHLRDDGMVGRLLMCVFVCSDYSKNPVRYKYAYNRQECKRYPMKIIDTSSVPRKSLF
jgi:hypothetical protein